MSRVQAVFRWIGGVGAILWISMMDSTPMVVQFVWLVAVLVAFALSGDLRKLFQ